MTDWSVPAETFFDGVSGATPLGIVKEGLAQGLTLSQIYEANNFSYAQMLFTRIGSAGEISAIALLIGFVYLLVRRVIRPHITLSIWATVFVFSGILWLCNPEQFTDPIFNLLTGCMLLGSIFMATDYVTSPITDLGKLIFGIILGVLTGVFRIFGPGAEGVSYAIIFSNLLVPLIEKWTVPVAFGKGGKK